MTCKNCGYENKLGVRYCQRCGPDHGLLPGMQRRQGGGHSGSAGRADPGVQQPEPGLRHRVHTVMDELYHCRFRCAIEQIAVSANENLSVNNDISVSLSITFYEKQIEK